MITTACLSPLTYLRLVFFLFPTFMSWILVILFPYGLSMISRAWILDLWAGRNWLIFHGGYSNLPAWWLALFAQRTEILMRFPSKPAWSPQLVAISTTPSVSKYMRSFLSRETTTTHTHTHMMYTFMLVYVYPLLLVHHLAGRAGSGKCVCRCKSYEGCPRLEECPA